jgi:hypothetical protein
MRTEQAPRIQRAGDTRRTAVPAPSQPPFLQCCPEVRPANTVRSVTISEGVGGHSMRTGAPPKPRLPVSPEAAVENV